SWRYTACSKSRNPSAHRRRTSFGHLVGPRSAAIPAGSPKGFFRDEKVDLWAERRGVMRALRSASRWIMNPEDHAIGIEVLLSTQGPAHGASTWGRHTGPAHGASTRGLVRPGSLPQQLTGLVKSLDRRYRFARRIGCSITPNYFL